VLNFRNPLVSQFLRRIREQLQPSAKRSVSVS
jgi:hypothetical protein